MHTGDGFLLVYSITDDQTLEDLRLIREQILRVDRDRKVCAFYYMIAIFILKYFIQIPLVVVGNKVDLEAKDRAVSREEGKALAREFNAAFLEVSVSF